MKKRKKEKKERKQSGRQNGGKVTGQPADSWGTTDGPSAATFMSKGRKQNTAKKNRDLAE